MALFKKKKNETLDAGQTGEVLSYSCSNTTNYYRNYQTNLKRTENTVIAALERYTSTVVPATITISQPSNYLAPALASFTKNLQALVLTDLITKGNSYLALDERNGQSYFTYIPNCRPNFDSLKTRIEYYSVPTSISTEMKLPVERVVHFRYQLDRNNPLMGYSPFMAAESVILADTAIDKYTLDIVTNTAPVGLVISLPSSTKATPEQLSSIKNDIQDQLFNKRGGVMVINQQTEVDPIGFSPADVDIQGMSERLEERICAAWGLPPAVVNLTQREQKYSNFQQAENIAIKYFVNPMRQLLVDNLYNNPSTAPFLRAGQQITIELLTEVQTP